MMKKYYLNNIRRYDTTRGSFVDGSVTVENGEITALDEKAPQDAVLLDGQGLSLVPGLVDAHTHGRIGFDFDSASVAEMERMCRSYAADGTTTVVPTIASAPFEQILAAIDRVREANCFPAVHLEGRYLNPKRRGAHREDLLHLPDTEELKILLSHTGTLPFHITMAPELSGSAAFIGMATKAGATVSMGHSDATYEQANEAFANGITGIAHLCNAMAPIHHRMPGNITAALLGDVYCELIADGLHVHPGMIRLIQKVKSTDRLVLITDSMSATGCPDGEYAIAGQAVFVKNGKALNGEGALAGSTITLFDGLVNLMRFCDVPLETAIRYATVNPARMLGLDDKIGAIAVGKRADFILLDADTMTKKAVFQNGEQL